MKPFYSRNGITIYCGDCLEILPNIEGDFSTMITDPPYEIKNKFGTSSLYGFRRMEFHFDVDGVTKNVVIPAFSFALQLVQSFHTFCEFEQYGVIANVAREFGFTPKPFVKIKKCPPPPMPGNWWPSGVEAAMYGYKPGAYFGDNSAKRVNVITADSYRHSIRASEKCDHPTQKWLPMIQYLVRTLAKPGDLILDQFAGSGTTLVAAQNEGRRAVGIELSEEYCKIAVERLRQPSLFTLPPNNANGADGPSGGFAQGSLFNQS